MPVVDAGTDVLGALGSRMRLQVGDGRLEGRAGSGVDDVHAARVQLPPPSFQNVLAHPDYEPSPDALADSAGPKVAGSHRPTGCSTLA